MQTHGRRLGHTSWQEGFTQILFVGFFAANKENEGIE